jgi:L-ascorbate metabolism protein UlaG (beta-lactamase superfamily)
MKAALFVPAAALCVLLGAGRAAAQAPKSDSIPTNSGDLKITPIGHASMMLEFSGKVIHVDPAGQIDFSTFPKADLILVTDIHGDHQSREKIDQLKKAGSIVVAPPAVAQTITEAQTLSNGQKKTIAGIEIEATPMYNLVRGPQPGTLFHDKGRGNGYILTLGGKRLYIAGDTECTAEMKALRNIDVAFLPMNLPYTMPPGEAAECAKAFQPKIVYPYHHRGSNVQEFADALKSTPGVEVRIRQWY